MAYTKLFGSIVTSTIWQEDDKTRILWITMLALADQNGEVMASIPGLARLAGIGLADTEAALAKLLAPDPYSRTPDYEGRRIARIPGGWELLNHAKYRRLASLEEARAANAERQRRHRARNPAVTPRNAPITRRDARVTSQTDKAEAEAEAEANMDGWQEGSSSGTRTERPTGSLYVPGPTRDRADQIHDLTRKLADKAAPAWRKPGPVQRSGDGGLS
jgi:hypothetical protein